MRAASPVGSEHGATPGERSECDTWDAATGAIWGGGATMRALKAGGAIGASSTRASASELNIAATPSPPGTSTASAMHVSDNVVTIK